ncbi:MAG: 2-dehydropantoate 2-reductase [Candidatus Omnitrophota bacterium]|nr:MAG: 2-dehydropantoate 2-reductase [Candidatus Omnitrophota bacterium]
MVRYLLFGAGAVGTLLGGLLAGAGHQVVFVGRRWNVEGIRSKGISISGVWGDYRIPPQSAYEGITDIPDSEKEFDAILICVKAFATGEAIHACLPLIRDETIVISCQNGYGNCQIIAATVGWRRTLGARLITGVELTEPGTVKVTVHADSIRIGHYLCDFPLSRIESIARTMCEAGIPMEATDRLEQYIWAKVLYNTALNPLGALLGVTYGDLAEHPETRRIMDRIMEEAFAVTSAHGIRQFWDCAEAYRQAFYENMVPPTAAHFPSMLRDLERRRRTEIGSLNEAICELGMQKGIVTPVNDTIVSLIRFREKLVLS